MLVSYWGKGYDYMNAKIIKKYKELKKHYNQIIAEEAHRQLMFESGSNSEDLKKQTWRISIAKITGLLALQKQSLKKTEAELDEMLENTLFSLSI